MRRTRPLRVKARSMPRVPVATIAAAAFALVAFALWLLTAKRATVGGLADTGSDISPWDIAGIALAVVAGIAFLVIGQIRRRSAG
ncbi:hypothetical protein HJ590_13025 [Naumannella sp. ID2617S]|nr:hypothetical protein [Naumannella sp. ID2617S]